MTIIPPLSPWVIFPAGAFVGPGDVVPSAGVWYGLRGYNATAANGTTKACNLRRDSDNSQMDFVILTSGALDVASITTFKGAANLFVTKMYDQSGHAIDCSNGTAANQPKFLLNQFGSLPAIQGNGSTLFLQSGGTLSAQAQPYVTTAVCDATTFASTGTAFGLTTVGLLGSLNSANTGFTGSGANVTATMNNNALHAMLGLANGASGVLNIDNTETTGNTGASAVVVNSNTFIFNDNFSDFFTGFGGEFGYWPSTMTATQRSNLVANMKHYWSIP